MGVKVGVKVGVKAPTSSGEDHRILATFGVLPGKDMVRAVGLEPTTHGLKVRCSSD